MLGVDSKEENILWFRQIGKEDIPVVGGKGANLGEMANSNFPVPPGFVVTAKAYFRYLLETGIKDKVIKTADAIDVENNEQLQRESEKIRELIKRTKMGSPLANEIKKAYTQLCEKRLAWLTSSEEEFVAVRSSATAEDLPSISENEQVLVKVNGKPMYDRIGKIYEKIAGSANPQIEVPGMEGNKIEWLKAKSLFRHKANNGTLFKIITATGRQIVVSPNHSLIALDEDRLEPKTVNISEIGKGTRLPAVGLIPALNCEETIRALDFVKGTDVTEWQGRVMIKNRSSNWKIQNGLPKEIKVREEFAYFLGHYAAEGSTYKNNGISITNSNFKILEKIESVLRKLGIYNKSKINKYSVRAYCPSMVRFLHETSGKPIEGKKGKGKLCATKRVPDFAFGWSKKNIAAFLRGCFDGDGTVGESGVSYCTTSEMLAGGMLKLLEILGFGFYVTKKKNFFVISIPLHETEKFNNLVGFEDEGKKNKIKQLIKDYRAREKHPEFKYGITISEKLAEKIMEAIGKKLQKQDVEIAVCKKCGQNAEQSSYYKNKKRYYCRNCKKTRYQEGIQLIKTKKYVYFNEKGQFKKSMIPWNYGHMQGKHSLNALKRKTKRYGLQNLFAIFEGTVKWDEVKEITPIKYDGFVYDFVVPGTENFAAGLGGIITHNSASFAGQQETFLNIKGQNAVVDAVQRCWASLFTARAIYYRKRNNFETEKVGIAVVVQKMVNSKISGVMFTANPTGDETMMVIEAVFGLGETIVSGSVTPDTYTVEKGSIKLVQKQIHSQEFKLVREGKGNVREKLPPAIARKQKLQDKTIIELAKLGKQIEAHYKLPQDIEWAIEDKQLLIVQSRPITTLGLRENVVAAEKRKKQMHEMEDKIILRGLAASPGTGTGKAKIVLNPSQIGKISDGDVLVAKMTTPDWVPAMKKSAAIITDEGGVTCHAAIVSRELGIACVVGTEKATGIIEDDDIVTVNGYDGVVFKGKVAIEKPVEEKAAVIEKEDVDKLEKALAEQLEEKKLEKEKAGLKEEKPKKRDIVEEKEVSAQAEEEKDWEQRVAEEHAEVAEKVAAKAEELVEEYGAVKAEEMPAAELLQEEEKLVDLLRTIAVKVKVNVALPDAAEQAAATNADGVGLLRAEHMITAAGKHPAEFIREQKEEELVKAVHDGIKQVAERFKGKPVWYRTFDARSDEFRELQGGEKEPHEDNPMLGWHGIRRDLDEPDLLKAQFKAIKELVDEGFDNLGVMLPFVQNVEELRKAKEIAAESGLLREKVRFGVMIETPAAVWSIDELIKEGIDFVSFGTNDLTQLTLGIDRNNERIQKQFNELHPAILRQLRYVIKKCKRAGVQTSICGQAGSNKEMVRQLVRYGIDSVSANIDAVEEIRRTVLIEEKKLILDKEYKK